MFLKIHFLKSFSHLIEGEVKKNRVVWQEWRQLGDGEVRTNDRNLCEKFEENATGQNAPDICVDQHIFFSYDAPVNFSAWRHGAPVHIELSPWQLGRYTRAGKSQAFFV